MDVGHATRVGQHGVEIGRLEQVVAGQELLRRRERPVGDLRLAAADADGLGGVDAVQTVGSDQQPASARLSVNASQRGICSSTRTDGGGPSEGA
jgi:hypothetical protein